MKRMLSILALFLLVPVFAQDSSSEDAEAETQATSEDSSSESSEELYEDDFELDLGNDDHLEDDEDVFEASVEVSFQQSVSFPTDI